MIYKKCIRSNSKRKPMGLSQNTTDWVIFQNWSENLNLFGETARHIKMKRYALKICWLEEWETTILTQKFKNQMKNVFWKIMNAEENMWKLKWILPSKGICCWHKLTRKESLMLLKRSKVQSEPTILLFLSKIRTFHTKKELTRAKEIVVQILAKNHNTQLRVQHWET